MSKYNVNKRLITTVFLSVCSYQVFAFEIDAGNAEAEIYGFVKLNMIYDVDSRLGTFAIHRAIALDGEDDATGHTQFDASHSRLGVKTSTVTGKGPVKAVIEGDFNAASRNGPFRLRLAYLEWEGIMAGQNWSNFGGFLGTLPTLDHLGQVGQGVILRQAQLRYTTDGLSVALEQGGDSGDWRGTVNSSADPAITPKNEDSLPDFTVRYETAIAGATVAVSGVLRQVEYYDQATDSEDSAVGWGINLEGLAPLTSILTLRGSLTFGDGMGGYQYVNPAGPGYVNANGDVKTIESIGGTIGLSAKVGVGKLGLGYGISTADIDDAVADGALASSADEKFDSIYLNYLWSPMKNVSYGVEAGLHSRKAQGGADGDAVRLQAQVLYSF